MNAAEQVMVAELRETVALDHGRIRQIYDIKNCPGMVVVYELSDVNSEGEFETVSRTYELSTGKIFEDGGEALLAWDAEQTDHEIAEALGETLLRFRHGLMRPLWADRKPGDKTMWIAAARGFRGLLNSLGFDIIRMEPK